MKWVALFGALLAVFGFGAWLSPTNSILWVVCAYLAVVAMVAFIAAAIRFGMASDERPVSSERWDR